MCSVSLLNGCDDPKSTCNEMNDGVVCEKFQALEVERVSSKKRLLQMVLAEAALNQLFGLLLSLGRSRCTQWCVDTPLLGLAV